MFRVSTAFFPRWFLMMRRSLAGNHGVLPPFLGLSHTFFHYPFLGVGEICSFHVFSPGHFNHPQKPMLKCQVGDLYKHIWDLLGVCLRLGGWHGNVKRISRELGNRKK
jgi:hypothetical protein